jgi:uncharacterized protein YggE
VLSKEELPPSGNTMFIEASVLMNVKADEYVAVLGITEEGTTVADCARKMDDTVRAFSDALKSLGVSEEDLFVDYIAQNRIYGFEVTGDIAREKLVGFELKKNVSIHYKDRSLLDQFVAAAARAQIFDLIKVDYIVRDTASIRERLAAEAARVVRQKAARYEQTLGTRLRPPAQVYAERPAIYYPADLYDSYTAAESEDISSATYRQRYTVQGARKSRTFYFNPLDANGFDEVINPVVLEPVVQFTLYLKAKYEIQPGPATRAAGPRGRSAPRRTKPTPERW